MKQKRETVESLAKKVSLEADDMLILLWEAGLEDYSDSSDVIRSRDLQRARRFLGIATRREVTSPGYWQELLGLDEAEFRSLLKQLNITISPKARRLPKGSVVRLRRALAQRKAPAPPPKPPVPAATAKEATSIKALEWRSIGRERELRLLGAAEVEGIHSELARDFAAGPDPIDPPGVASVDLLESAVFRQYTSFAGISKYPTVEMAGAALMHSIVHDHPFFNGNKRTALVAMIVLLDENGVMLTCSEEELFRFVLRVAQHKIVSERDSLSDREVLYIAEWIFRHSRVIESGDRPIQWRRLRQILRSFECHLQMPPGRGNRMNIRRSVPVRGGLGLLKERVASTQVKYADDGREANLVTIKKIRKDLELDEEHGVDSIYFYSRSGSTTADFIAKYQKVLKKLARL